MARTSSSVRRPIGQTCAPAAPSTAGTSSRPSLVRTVASTTAGTSSAWSARYLVMASVASSAQYRSSRITTTPAPCVAQRSTRNTASAVTRTGSAGAGRPGSRQGGTTEASTAR